MKQDSNGKAKDKELGPGPKFKLTEDITSILNNLCLNNSKATSFLKARLGLKHEVICIRLQKAGSRLKTHSKLELNINHLRRPEAQSCGLNKTLSSNLKLIKLC